MAKVYDSADMQRVVNMLLPSIQSLQSAHKRINAINLDGLSGSTRDAIQRQIADKSEVIQALIKELNIAVEEFTAKQSVLK